MSAVDEIHAAIDKLTRLKSDGARGPWAHEPYGGQNQNGDYSGGCVYDDRGEYLLMDVPDGDGALIVTLHATIDAQLAILRNERWEVMREQRPPFHDILTLARAINGGTN